MTDEETDESDAQEPEAQPVYPGRGPNREGMVDAYLPNEDDWVAKTVLDLNDPHAVAALQQFHRMFPEVGDELQDAIDEFSEEFLKGRTSIGGSGRKEYNRIFEAMYGGHPDDDANKWGALASALGADEDD